MDGKRRDQRTPRSDDGIHCDALQYAAT